MGVCDLSFYKDRKVLVTGHTGFKGAWLSKILLHSGAKVTGYALAPSSQANLFEISGINKEMTSVFGDVRDFELLMNTFQEAEPEVVFHLAAQPIVRDSYRDPRHTYEVNVMGTVNVLECIRQSSTVKSFVNVTTDKVYKNNEWVWGYRESDELDGYDPYSNSKSCSELVTHSYRASFFQDSGVAVSTARAGNVIGGGDFARDRIIPDCVRAVERHQDIVVRNPHSVRPYQHVIDPLYAYLLIAQKQHEHRAYADSYNIGPDEAGCICTADLVDLFCCKWEEVSGMKQGWIRQHQDGPHEAQYLKLDCSKLKSTLGWTPRWSIEQAVEKVCEWVSTYLSGGDISAAMDRQIEEFLSQEVRV